MKSKLNKFIEEENITLLNVINPIFIFNLLYKYRYIHFFLTGTSGIAINLFFSWFFVELISNRNEYLFGNITVLETTIGIIVGTTLNLIYNFVLHTLVNFKPTKKHKRRFVYFITYSLIMSYFIILPIVLLVRNFLEIFFLGTIPYLSEYSYLIATGSVVFVTSILTYVFFKIFLFKD